MFFQRKCKTPFVTILLIALFFFSVKVAAVTAPIDISCQGWEVDTVRLFWGDNQASVTEYRVQRNIDGAGWSTIATIPASDSKFYSDTGIDTAKNNRYRVQAFDAADSSTANSAICNNRRIYETANFRIFYGLRGTTDDCPLVDGNEVCLANINSGADNTFVKRAGEAMEGSLDAFTRVGFAEGKGSTHPQCH